MNLLKYSQESLTFVSIHSTQSIIPVSSDRQNFMVSDVPSISDTIPHRET